METPEQDTTVHRLERLEREHRRLVHGLERSIRWWRAVAVTSSLGAALLGLLGAHRAEESKVVAAEQVVINNGAGKTRLRLGLRPDGGPAISFLDEAGVERILMYTRREGTPRVQLRDQSGKVRLALYLNPDGSPQFGLVDQEGKGHPALPTEPNGGAAAPLAAHPLQKDREANVPGAARLGKPGERIQVGGVALTVVDVCAMQGHG